MLKTLITDPKTGMQAEIDHGRDSHEPHALIVATRPLKTFSNRVNFFFSGELGVDMNVAAVFTGTPLNVHDGMDKIQWTATSIVGGDHWDPDDNNHHAKDSCINVLDYTDLSNETITISVNETVTVVTEGINYDAEISNDVTAANIATFMNTIIGIDATSDANVVTLFADDDYDIDNLLENSSSADLTATARCIQATGTVNNDVLEIKTTDADLDLSNYAALTGWIYLTAWDTRGTKGVEVELWLNNLMAENTVKADLGNFVDTGLFNVWQKFTIAFSEFKGAGSTIDSFRFRTIDIGAGQPPDYYMDYLRIQETGTIRDYNIEPKLGTWLHVEEFTYSFAATFDGCSAVENADAYWKSNNLSYIPYNGFLSINKLSDGILFKQVKNNIIQQSSVIKQVMDILQLPGTTISSSGSDGINSWLTITHKMTEPLLLKSEDDDRLTFSISDDLSNLLHFRVVAGCREEQR